MVTKRWSRAVCAVGAILAASALLAGCDDIDRYGDFDLGFDGRYLLVAVCVDAEITDVIVEEYVRDRAEHTSTRIWEASGATSVVKGDFVVVGGENAGLENSLIDELNARPGTRYFVRFNDVPGEVPSALFVWPEGGVTAGEWLSTDGTIASVPCAA